MGNPINSITFDSVIDGSDYLVGTDAVTGVTYNYRISDIGSFFVAGSTSIIDTTNVLDVTETAIKDFIQVINTLAIPWTVQSGQFPLINVTDQNAVFDGVYMLKKSQSSTTLYGNGETQVVLSDFIGLRLQNDIGESNTMTSAGGESLVKTKSGVDLPIKGLVAGTNISFTPTTNSITINLSGSLGETNTLGDVGSGEGLAGTKSGSEVKVKSLTIEGGTISSTSTDVTIRAWGKVRKTASWTITESDSYTTFQIDSGSTVEVTIPHDLSAEFEAAFIQLGVGDVDFLVTGGASILGSNGSIKGQFNSAWIETQTNDVTKIILLGDLKA